MSASSELLIKIKTILEKEGVEAATKHIDGLIISANKLSRDGSQSAKDTGKAFDKLGEGLNTARGKAQDLGNVMNGVGKIASGSLINAFQGLFQVFGGFVRLISNLNPWIKIISIVTALAGALFALWQKFKPVQDGFAELEKAAQKDADALKKVEAAATDLNNAQLQNVKKQADDLAKGLNDAAEAASRTRNQLAAAEDANLGREIARRDLLVAQGKMSREEADMLNASDIVKSKERKRAVELGELGMEEQRQKAAVDASESTAITARAKADADKKAYEEVRQAKGGRSTDQIQQELNAAKERLDYAKANPAHYDSYARSVIGVSKEDTEKAQKKYDDLKKSYSAAVNEPILYRRMLDSEKAAKAAEDSAATTKQSAQVKQQDIDSRRGVIQIEAETDTYKAATDTQLAKSRMQEINRQKAEEAKAKAAEADAASRAAMSPRAMLNEQFSEFDRSSRKPYDQVYGATGEQDKREIAEGIKQGLKAEEIAAQVQETGTVLKLSFAELTKVISDIQAKMEELNTRNKTNRD